MMARDYLVFVEDESGCLSPTERSTSISLGSEPCGDDSLGLNLLNLGTVGRNIEAATLRTSSRTVRNSRSPDEAVSIWEFDANIFRSTLWKQDL